MWLKIYRFTLQTRWCGDYHYRIFSVNQVWNKVLRLSPANCGSKVHSKKFLNNVIREFILNCSYALLSGSLFQLILTQCSLKVQSKKFLLNVIRVFILPNCHTEGSLRTAPTQFHHSICSKQFFLNVIRGFIQNNSYSMPGKVQSNKVLHSFII